MRNESGLFELVIAGIGCCFIGFIVIGVISVFCTLFGINV
jgi:hypothetical protein